MFFKKCIFAIFQKHSGLTKAQYGFHNNKSTVHAILNVLTNIYDNVGNNKYTALIFLESKQTFGYSMSLYIVKKLELYGTRGIALKLLKSFLTNGGQYVVCQELRTINNFGVSQGSNLGPLLFLIY